MARQEKTRHDTTRQYKTVQGKARQDTTRQHKIRQYLGVRTYDTTSPAPVCMEDDLTKRKTIHQDRRRKGEMRKGLSKTRQIRGGVRVRVRVSVRVRDRGGGRGRGKTRQRPKTKDQRLQLRLKLRPSKTKIKTKTTNEIRREDKSAR